MSDPNPLDKDMADCLLAIAALEGQRATLGDAVLDLATAPLRARLLALQRPGGVHRRHVTVLFADVVGSTAMAQGLDAEDTLALLSGTLQRMAALVEAHQGRVLRFTGDGVKAAFGMDEAREDDADRAVRAGLAILQAGREQAVQAAQQHGIADFAVRVGVHTGDAALGAGVEADNTAMGVSVNIAARMEQSAPPGALRISQETWSHVRGLFDMEPQPPLQVKGMEAPMQTYLVRGALDRRGAGVERGVQGLSTPLIGRQAELQRLVDTMARAHRSRQLQALTLLGDAGLGKSRLLRELRSRTLPPPEEGGYRWLVVRSQPGHLLRPWALLSSLLALQCGVADTDSAEQARSKVLAGLSPWFQGSGERQAQLIGQLSGLDFGDSPHVRGLDPRSLRDLALAALVDYLRALAGHGPLPVLVAEDLHWADDSSLDLLLHLQAHAAELPLALVMTARPALLARRPDWSAGDTLVHLGPLPAASSDELAQALLHRLGAVPAPLAALIIRQSEGNPYYMEELVRRLIDDGVIAMDGPTWSVREERLHNLRLPTTLVGLLQARLDALPPAERLAARQASVIGHVFWDDALQSLDAHAAQALPALQRAAFVKSHATSDFEGTAERQFDHHLLHQVTYDTLLKAERRVGHGAAARWLRARTLGRSAEFLALTAEHAERAGDHALAADCFELAGQEAKRRFANSAALALLRRALALLGDTAPARRLDLLYDMEGICDTTGARSMQDSLHDEIAAVLHRHPDDAGQARLWFMRSLLADRRNDRAAALPLAEKALETAERCGAARWAATAQGQLAWLKNVQRDRAGASAHVEAGLQWVQKIEDAAARAETECRVRIISSVVSMDSDRPEEARTTLLEVVQLGEALGAQRMQLSAMINLSECTKRLCRYDEYANWAQRALTLAQTMGAVQQQARAAGELGDALCLQGERNKAAPLFELSLALYRQMDDRPQIALALMSQADSCLELGDAQGALHWCAVARAEPWDLGALRVFQLGTIEGHAQVLLGQLDAARLTVNTLMDQLDSGAADLSDTNLILERRACQQIAQAVGDARSWPMLQQLHADLQAHVARLTDPADADRLIQANPYYRGIVADYLQHAAAQGPP